MTNHLCGAFRYKDGNCKLLKSEGVYINSGESSPTNVYIFESDYGKELRI